MANLSSKRYDHLLGVLPPYGAKRWLYPFEIAELCPVIAGEALHDLLQRAVKHNLADRRKVGKRWQYARAKR